MSYSLFLVRHAQTNEKEGDQKDIDRTLTSDGLRDATRLGQEIKNSKEIPDMIISSSAVRALHTATLISEQCGYDPDKIHVNEELYNAPVRILLQAVNNCKQDWKKVMIVCHNPGVSYLVEYVSGDEVGSLPPGTMIEVEFDISDWSEVSSANGVIKEKLFPESK